MVNLELICIPFKFKKNLEAKFTLTTSLPLKFEHKMTVEL